MTVVFICACNQNAGALAYVVDRLFEYGDGRSRRLCDALDDAVFNRRDLSLFPASRQAREATSFVLRSRMETSTGETVTLNTVRSSKGSKRAILRRRPCVLLRLLLKSCLIIISS